MADNSLASHKRGQIKCSVGQTAALRRRQNAISVAKDRREALVRTKRYCRVAIGGGVYSEALADSDMMLDEEQEVLDAQTSSAVQALKSAISYQGKDSIQKRVNALHDLRCLLSKSELPAVGTALNAGVIPVLVQCMSFGSPDEQVLDAAWCLTNIAAGTPEETKALLPALPMLIAHLGEKSQSPVAEQCAWALGNVAGEDEELRNTLLSQGALLPVARMMLLDKGSSVRTAAWALSNLIKGPNPRAATELIRIEGVLDAIVRHLKNADEELATEVAWVAVYLSSLSNIAMSMMVKGNVIQLLVERLDMSNNLQLLIPVLRCLGNLVAGDPRTTSLILVVGEKVTVKAVLALLKCLKSEQRVLKKEAAWVMSNMAAESTEHKNLIFSSEAVPLLLQLLLTAPFDIRKEVAYVLGNLCVTPVEGSKRPAIVVEHLVSLVDQGCLHGFLYLARSVDIEAAKLALQFLELVLRGMPRDEGPKIVEKEDGIEALERFQFHENDELRIMANGLVDTYFGEDYGLEE